MIRKFLVIMTVVASITNSSSGSPHNHDDDPYKPVIRLLKEIRKQRKHDGGSFNRDEFDRQSSFQNSQFQFPSNSGGNSGGGGGGNGGSPPTPILTPGNSGSSSGISSIIPPAGGSSSNYPPILPNIPSGSEIFGQLGINNAPQLPQLPPYPIEQVNRGVSTIINGVRSFDLGQILRGAFVFPRNDNVRNVANNVIDSIFGAVKPPSG